MATHPTPALWMIGIAAIAIGWFIPGAGGFFWLGVGAIIVGTLIGLMGAGRGR